MQQNQNEHMRVYEPERQCKIIGLDLPQAENDSFAHFPSITFNFNAFRARVTHLLATHTPALINEKIKSVF